MAFRVSWTSTLRRLAVSLLGVVVVAPCGLVMAPHAGAIAIREDVSIDFINRYTNRPAYRSIGRIDTAATRRSQSLAGTGTLVAPQWVLTAGHVVEGSNATRFTVRRQEFGIVGWAAAPGYDTTAGFGADLALVKLDRPATHVDPAVLRQSNQVSEFQRNAMILGYGQSGFGDEGINSRTAQTLRISTNVIDGIVDDNILITDFDSPFANLSQSGTSNASTFEGALTPGDSGGPAFMWDGSGFTLAAVAVYSASPTSSGINGTYGEINGFVRLKNYLPWINDVISGRINPTLRSTSGGGITRPGGLPEPGVAGLLLAGAGLMIRRRCRDEPA